MEGISLVTVHWQSSMLKIEKVGQVGAAHDCRERREFSCCNVWLYKHYNTRIMAYLWQLWNLLGQRCLHLLQEHHQDAQGDGRNHIHLSPFGFGFFFEVS